jgi:hypothetical protein
MTPRGIRTTTAPFCHPAPTTHHCVSSLETAPHGGSEPVEISCQACRDRSTCGRQARHTSAAWERDGGADPSRRRSSSGEDIRSGLKIP